VRCHRRNHGDVHVGITSVVPHEICRHRRHRSRTGRCCHRHPGCASRSLGRRIRQGSLRPRQGVRRRPDSASGRSVERAQDQPRRRPSHRWPENDRWPHRARAPVAGYSQVSSARSRVAPQTVGCRTDRCRRSSRRRAGLGLRSDPRVRRRSGGGRRCGRNPLVGRACRSGHRGPGSGGEDAGGYQGRRRAIRHRDQVLCRARPATPIATSKRV
jgi:hypothetical protein